MVSSSRLLVWVRLRLFGGKVVVFVVRLVRLRLFSEV